MRYFLHIAYDGSNYHGWQRQPNVISVQQSLEEVLEKVFKYPITANGCGRTDAGVHASQYVVHIDLKEKVAFDIKVRLNQNLPEDIAIHEVIEVDDNRHSRFDAVSRTYDYFIHLYKDPFLEKYSSYYAVEDLDIAQMQKAADLFINYQDYRAICKQPDAHDNTICHIIHAKLNVSIDKQRLHFTITSDRFLRGMIRLCIMFLLKVGKGKMTIEEFEELLSAKKELPNKRDALPNGLFLSKVEYPYLSLEAHENMCSLLKAAF